MWLLRFLRPLWRALPLGTRLRQRIKQALLNGLLGRLAQAPALDLPAWDGDWQALLAPLAEPADRLLVIDWQPPTPDLDSGSVRLWSLLELMLELGLGIDFIADRDAPEPRYAEDLRARGIRTIIGPEAAFAHLAACGHRYRQVWISRPEMAERYLAQVRAYAPESLVIYDTVDLHWVRFERGVPYAADPQGLRNQARHYQRLELANARAADRVIAVTEEERARLLAEDPGLAVLVLPNIHEVAEEVPPWEERRDLFFIGGFQHAPNLDAMRYCASEILPLIRAELPQVRLRIAGSQMPEAIYALASPAIEPIGYIPEVKPYFDQARVFVAPLRYGAGMKGKIGQALGFGLPVVTTSIGAEGMGLVDGEHALIADDPQSFAQAVVRLYRDRALWQRLSESGQAWVKAHYSRSAVAERLRAVLNCAQGPQATAGPGHTRVATDLPAATPRSQSEVHPGPVADSDRRVLILGVYLAAVPNHALAISRELQSSRDWSVELRWAAIGGEGINLGWKSRRVDERSEVHHQLGNLNALIYPHGCRVDERSEPQQASELSALTYLHSPKPLPKFVLLNRLLQGLRLEDYRYLLVVDDDVELPPGFLDLFLAIQERRGFTLAQPARTPDSFVDHRFVIALQGIESRASRFVEIGPVFALRREGFAAILPFDEAAPMGWGLDFVWPLLLEQRGLRLGIIDAAPVRHALRPPVSTYDYAKTEHAMRAFLERRPHLEPLEAWVALVTYPLSPPGSTQGSQTTGQSGRDESGVGWLSEARSAAKGHLEGSVDGAAPVCPTAPRPKPVRPSCALSAILCTRNRAKLLARALAALCAQTLDPERFEVILIDDGSTDETAQVAERFAPLLNLRYAYQPHAGLAAAKNHGVCLARAPIVLFVDDDDVLDNRALEEHLKSHQREPELGLAVLGWTGLGGKAARSPLMRYVTEVGCQLFYYPAIRDGQLLDFSFFWGGRSSCKRELLLREGLFDPQFRFGAEDIELAYRLRKAGLRVRYNAQAKSYMIRDLSVDDFARRSELQGRANWAFYRKHPQPLVWEWAQLAGVEEEWSRIAPHYPRLLKAARDLDRWARSRIEQDLPLDQPPEDWLSEAQSSERRPGGQGLERALLVRPTALLYRAYAALFRASRIKGTVERMREGP